MLPDEWAGRAGKDVHVVIKRKAVDTRAMYGVFKTKPAVPLCSKCQTPFNYSWRNGGGSDKLLQQRQQRLLDAALSRPTTAASTTAAAAVGSATDPALSAGADGPMDGESRGVAAAAHRRVLAKADRFIRGLCSPCRRRRSASSKPFDGGGVAGAEEEPELWYGREFRRQLMTYFKPELSRPAGGGRYPVGARVACFAGKDAWYPGAVAASRENDTYDVRYDNGDIAQHVFSHMIRFEPVHADSRLTCCYYGLALVAAATWPLAGSWYFSSTSSAAAASATTAAAFVALPALVVGAAGTLAVAFQFWEIYADNRSTGLCVATKFAVIFALPSMSLALVGGLAVVKALKPASAGSWVEVRDRGRACCIRDRETSCTRIRPHDSQMTAKIKVLSGRTIRHAPQRHVEGHFSQPNTTFCRYNLPWWGSALMYMKSAYLSVSKGRDEVNYNRRVQEVRAFVWV